MSHLSAASHRSMHLADAHPPKSAGLGRVPRGAALTVVRATAPDIATRDRTAAATVEQRRGIDAADSERYSRRDAVADLVDHVPAGVIRPAATGEVDGQVGTAHGTVHIRAVRIERTGLRGWLTSIGKFQPIPGHTGQIESAVVRGGVCATGRDGIPHDVDGVAGRRPATHGIVRWVAGRSSNHWPLACAGGAPTRAAATRAGSRTGKA